MSYHFDKNDQLQLRQQGIPLPEIERQLGLFQSGLPFLQLHQACHPGNGIRILPEEEVHRLARLFEKEMEKGRAMKFVPSSGAASRMFHSLLGFYHALCDSQDLRGIPQPDSTVKTFFDHLDQFAFKEDLAAVLSLRKKDLANLRKEKKYREILAALFAEDGLGYASIPKGLIKFHRYADHSRTAFEEHLVEGAHYTKDRFQRCRIHFTLSQTHRKQIENYLREHLARYEGHSIHYELAFSVQKPATDTIAVDSQNQPFRSQDGRILFRPSGHGALLENLNNLKGDLVFIKNIDNVTIDEFKPVTYLYKKALGGLLVELQSKTFSLLHALGQEAVSESVFQEAEEFASVHLGWRFEKSSIPRDLPGKREFWISKLNRPLRVCGVVPNQGEPGGGPYWVRLSDGSLSCQIVESAQVDRQDLKQDKIFRDATHFNPVDLVCGVRGESGEPFDLRKFRDPQAGFISKKSQEGRELKALERPGLWNGGMAFWNTLFVEVPLLTFSPVKTVNDLLRREHQVRF